jgi:hypothetical protein
MTKAIFPFLPAKTIAAAGESCGDRRRTAVPGKKNRSGVFSDPLTRKTVQTPFSLPLRLTRVRRWRIACQHLARVFDEVLRRHLQAHIGTSPW